MDISVAHMHLQPEYRDNNIDGCIRLLVYLDTGYRTQLQSPAAKAKERLSIIMEPDR